MVSTKIRTARRLVKDVHMENTALDQCLRLAVVIHVRVQMGLLHHRPVVLPVQHWGQEMVARVLVMTVVAIVELR